MSFLDHVERETRSDIVMMDYRMSNISLLRAYLSVLRLFVRNKTFMMTLTFNCLILGNAALRIMGLT